MIYFSPTRFLSSCPDFSDTVQILFRFSIFTFGEIFLSVDKFALKLFKIWPVVILGFLSLASFPGVWSHFSIADYVFFLGLQTRFLEIFLGTGQDFSIWSVIRYVLVSGKLFGLLT